MKVWVLTGGWNYDGEEVIGVFYSERECQERADKVQASYDYVDWKEFVIGE